MSFSSNNSLLARHKNSISKLSGLTLWLDASDASTIVMNGSTVSQWNDKSGNGYNATQPTATAQPTISTSPSRVVFNKSTQKISNTLPAITGTMFLATPNGTQVYGVNIPPGSYDIGSRGGLYMPDNAIIGQIICQGNLSTEDINNTITWLQSKGSGNNYGSVKDFTGFWRGWSELASFPAIDTSAATTLYATWNGCSGLTSFPALNTANVTTFSSAWSNCTGFTNFPLIDTSKGNTFAFAWSSCSNLTSFPAINTSNATSVQAAWYTCGKLTSFPFLDTSKVVNFASSWNNCVRLTAFPNINTGYGTNFSGTWGNCSSLTSFPSLNVINATTFSATWQNCNNLVTFPANFFNGCLATNFTNAFSSTKLSQSSIDNILVSINSNGTSNGTFNQSGGSAPSSAGQSAITAMRSRGWTVTVTGGF